MEKHTAVYVRVSSRKQDQASQLPDLKRWVKAAEGPVEWYEDTASGLTMDRPAWNRLSLAMASGLVGRVVVWRLDRLGRTASGLTALFDELVDRQVGLVSLREGLDLATPAGRLMCGIMASVAKYETEVRAERIQAGIEVARERGTRSGKPFGRPPGSGRPTKLTPGKRRECLELRAAGTSVAAIARAVRLDRKTVYLALRPDP